MDEIFVKIVERIRKIYNNIYLKVNKKKFAHIGKNVRILFPYSMIYRNISIGNDVFINSGATFWAVHSKIIIETKVVIGPNVTIMAGNHNFSEMGKYIFDSHEKKPEDDLDVIIEQDVWIGCNVIILKGVTIGKGSVIGAGSVVAKNVEPYSINAGNPCRKIKERFTKDQILEHEKLLKLENGLT